MAIRASPHVHQIPVQFTHWFVIECPVRNGKLGRDHADVAIDMGYDDRLLELRNLDMVKKEIKPRRASNIPGIIPFVKHELGSHQFFERRSIMTIHRGAPAFRKLHELALVTE